MIKKFICVICLFPTLCCAQAFRVVGEIPKKNYFVKNEVFYEETNRKDVYIDYFNNLNKNYISETKAYYKTQDVTDTHLKSSLSEIKLSISYKEPEILKGKVFSYAPIGGYNDGWSGIRTFFNDDKLGVCSFSYQKFIWMQTNAKEIKYDINNKPTFYYILGNNEKGFVYTIEWVYDFKEYIMQSKLECVSKTFDRSIIEKMIELGKRIDIV